MKARCGIGPPAHARDRRVVAPTAVVDIEEFGAKSTQPALPYNRGATQRIDRMTPLRPLTSAALVLLSTIVSAQERVPAEIAPAITAASAWTARFTQGLSGMLFREKYLQKTDGASPSTQGTLSRSSRRREVLTEANVFLLRPGPGGEFVLFRDVYSMNGRAIADHTERLRALLTDGSAKAVDQARKLTEASAAYNIGSVSRNLNIPTMALRYLEEPGRARFTSAGTTTIDGLDMLIVDFEETTRPTVVRGAAGGDVPARGRYWIHPGSGAVARAHVDFTGPQVSGRMEIDMVMNRDLGAWVPKEMTEIWRALGQRITGLAQYDRFQRMSVSTGEIIR